MMDNEYVTKDAVQRVITNAATQLYITGQISKEESPKLVAYILHKVEQMTTADVAKRKHGKWLTNGYFAECSECKYEFVFDDYLPDVSMVEDLHMNFCPNCGADMRQDPLAEKPCDGCDYDKCTIAETGSCDEARMDGE